MDQFRDDALMLDELHNTRRTRPVQSASLSETIAGVTDMLGRELDAIAVERAVIGLYFTGVKLTGGVAGTCATPRDAGPGDVCCPISAHRVAFRHLAGRPAAELMQ